MRGYRLFPDNSNVAIEWRIKGFRIRTMLALWVFAGGFLGGVLFVVSAWAGAVVMLITAACAFLFAAYTYRVDPELVLSEGTMLRLLWRGVRRRFSNNDSHRD